MVRKHLFGARSSTGENQHSPADYGRAMLSDTGNRYVLAEILIWAEPQRKTCHQLAGFLLYSYDTKSEILMYQFNRGGLNT